MAAGPGVVDEYGHDEDHFDNDDFDVEDADDTPSMPVHPIAVDPEVSPEVVASMPVGAVAVDPEVGVQVGVPSMPVDAVVDPEVGVQVGVPSMPVEAARVDIGAAPGMGVSKSVKWDNFDIVSKQASQYVSKPVST